MVIVEAIQWPMMCLRATCRAQIDNLYWNYLLSCFTDALSDSKMHLHCPWMENTLHKLDHCDRCCLTMLGIAGLRKASPAVLSRHSQVQWPLFWFPNNDVIVIVYSLSKITATSLFCNGKWEQEPDLGKPLSQYRLHTEKPSHITNREVVFSYICDAHPVKIGSSYDGAHDWDVVCVVVGTSHSSFSVAFSNIAVTMMSYG